MFSPEKWSSLSQEERLEHRMQDCTQCHNLHPIMSRSFPGATKRNRGNRVRGKILFTREDMATPEKFTGVLLKKANILSNDSQSDM